MTLTIIFFFGLNFDNYTRMTNRTKNNEGSILLNESENEAIFSSLGKGNQTLCTGVVQLYLADEASHKQRWDKRCCGVVCFVKDNPKRSYFFRVFDPKSKQMVWEQAVYPRFSYKTPREYFHTFEAIDCQAGLNFASEDEAANFKKIVEGKLLERHQKRNEKKKEHKGTHGVSPPSPPAISNNVTGNNTTGSGIQPNVSVHLSQPTTVNTVKKKSKKKADSQGSKKKTLTKKDISTPVDFRHVNHVGMDSDIDIKSTPEMESLFEQVGIHNQADVDEATMDFIYDFVGKYGGFSALKEDLARTKADVSSVQQAAAPMMAQNDLPPPVPARYPPQQTVNRGPLPPTPTPPPPPTRTTLATNSHPPKILTSPSPPVANIPPTPSSPRPGASIPPSPIANVPSSPIASIPPSPIASVPPSPIASVPPSPIANIPPPPVTKPAPSAPPIVANIPTPPPAPVTAPPPPQDMPMPGRTGLSIDIHKGASLKHVDSGHGSTSLDGREGLLNQIRSGTILKPVTQSQSSAPQPKAGIVGALAAALAQRKNVIQGSDEEDDSDDIVDDDDDDEWDD